MKKLLSFLAAIVVTGTTSSQLLACNDQIIDEATNAEKEFTTYIKTIISEIPFYETDKDKINEILLQLIIDEFKQVGDSTLKRTVIWLKKQDFDATSWKDLTEKMHVIFDGDNSLVTISFFATKEAALNDKNKIMEILIPHRFQLNPNEIMTDETAWSPIEMAIRGNDSNLTKPPFFSKNYNFNPNSLGNILYINNVATLLGNAMTNNVEDNNFRANLENFYFKNIKNTDDEKIIESQVYFTVKGFKNSAGMINDIIITIPKLENIHIEWEPN